jgi:NAD(P)-dependent dehydrogenase (short-subunit alcohol dehydrogenase family)
MSLNPRITDWRGRIVWLVGASTGIGRATARRPACAGRQGGRVGTQCRPALDSLRADHPGSRACRWTPPTAPCMHAACARCWRVTAASTWRCTAPATTSAMRATDFDLDVALRHQQVN